jgi:hypothetical protein
MSDVITYGLMLEVVNNPQANGVERVNQEILRHLRAIAARVKNSWSERTVLRCIDV